MPAYESFTLGGPFRLSAYRVNQFAGREYAFGRLMYYNRMLPLPDILGAGLFAGAAAEVGRMDKRFDGAALDGDAVVGIGVPGGGHVRRPRLPGRRLRQGQRLDPLPAAGRAVAGLKPGGVRRFRR